MLPSFSSPQTKSTIRPLRSSPSVPSLPSFSAPSVRFALSPDLGDGAWSLARHAGALHPAPGHAARDTQRTGRETREVNEAIDVRGGMKIEIRMVLVIGL